MTLRRLLSLILTLSLAACGLALPNNYPPYLQPAPTQATPPALATGLPSRTPAVPTLTPTTATQRSAAIPMTSQEDAVTPSATPTALPAIRPVNADRLRPATIYPLFRRGLLRRAMWSPDGLNIVVETSLGLQVLSAGDLQKRFSLPDARPLYFLNSGELLVRDARTLSLLDLKEGGATPLAVPLPEDATAPPDVFALSPDGLTWVTAPDGVSLQVTALSGGSSEPVTLKTETNIPFQVIALNFSPDGQRLFATLSRTDGETEMAVVDTAAWQQIYSLYNADSAPLFSADSQRMLFASGEILNVAFTGDGRLWNNMALRIVKNVSATQTDILTAHAYDFLEGNTQVGVLYTDQLTDRELPDNRWFPSTLMIFDTEATRVVRYVNNLPQRLTGFAFSPDGETFLATSEDGLLRLFNSASGSQLVASEPYDVDNTPQVRADGRLVAYSLLETVALTDPATGRELSRLGSYPEATHLEARFAGMDTLAIFVETPWRTFLDTYDIPSGKFLFRYADLGSCTFNRNGSIMSCFDGVLRFFDMPSGRALLDNIPQGVGFEYTVSDSGSRVAYCTVGGEFVYIYQVRVGSSPKQIITGPRGVCGRLVFSPDETNLISSSGYIWSVSSGKQTGAFDALSGSGPAAVSPDGRLLLVYPQIADLATGKLLAVLQLVPQVQSAAFQRDGQHLLLQTQRGIELWAIAP